MDIILKYFSEFTPEQLEQLKSLENLYREWNEKINVISRKDIDSLYEKHVLHSLSIASVFSFKAGSKIVDLGCGGGFPGIPLALFFPEVQFHLVDSIAKKLKVVDAVAAAIDLKNVTTRHSRIEEIKNRKAGRPSLLTESVTGRQAAGGFDFVISRAVAPLKDLWQWSKPLIRKQQDGSANEHAPGLICLKGGDLAQEISESGTRPHIWPIHKIFEEPFFEEKYLLHVPI